MKAAFLGVAVLAIASVVFYFSTTVGAPKTSEIKPAAAQPLPAKALSLPLFFEPNQGQTDPQVKFLARGAGYGLFLTGDEAVLELQNSAASTPEERATHRFVAAERPAASVIRMRLDGASSSASVTGASPLPGKSNYFIGNDRSKWQHDVPQFARVEYRSVYPGVDLVYYGDQGQLEYDFRIAPGADPNQIALTFDGAAAHIDAADSGDLILSADKGEVRFRAPRIYQPAVPGSRTQDNAEKAVAGSFRQLAGNKIGFSLGEYDHSRELVIDPTLSYSTYIGGSGTESLVQVALPPLSAGLIYVAGSTTSTDFPLSTAYYPNNPPYQSQLAGAQNIFIAVLNPTLLPPQYLPAQQLVYATYLGGSGTDSLAGIAVDSNFSIYVAGTTNSPNFPTTTTAFQQGPQTGTHGFVSKIAFPTQPPSQVYNLTYSTYLAGNGVDTVTGLAVDTNQNAYVTGDTTSSNAYNVGPGFPANANGFQLNSNSPGNAQFFASKINTAGSGTQSMLYSTYFGGGYPVGATAIGGGIAVDQTSSNVNMYITGTTNMLPAPGPNGEPAFPLLNAQQACLNQPGINGGCNNNNPTSITDAFAAKINPNQAGSIPLYSTYLGGTGNDTGLAIAVDSSSNAYVTGLTYSTDWACPCTTGYQTANAGGGDAYIAEIGPVSGSIYPLNYFTYLGGSNFDIGNAIQVDPTQGVHLAGTTYSADLPITTDALQGYGGNGDAFAALISVTSGGTQTNPLGDYVTYLGGSQLDQGTGIALDSYNASYISGTTISPNFPVSAGAFQPTQNSGSQDAFVTKIGAVSALNVTAASGSPAPSPVAAGTQVAFTYQITNSGPDPASFVTFYATVPTTGLSQPAQAKVTSGSGNCTQSQSSVITCYIPSLAVCTTSSCASATVEVDVTPAITTPVLAVSVTGSASANNGPIQGSVQQQVQIVDFSVGATNSTPTITAGDIATIIVNFCPTRPTLGYSATITPSETSNPTIVTATNPVFIPSTVTLSGSSCGTTTLTIPTVARPVNTGHLLRQAPFYATWLPIGGLSLIGMGIGAGRKRRRWLAAAILGLVAGIILLQPACSSSKNTVTTTTGTAAGVYTITISGSAGTGASHNTQVQLQVN